MTPSISAASGHRVLAAEGDTWGLGGPTFLVVYLLLAAAVGIAGVAVRRRVLREPGNRPAAGWDAAPERVAYLNGGRPLALTSALSSLHTDGMITAENRTVQRVEGWDEQNRSALERAVLGETARQVNRRVLSGQRSVRWALNDLRLDLEARGLLIGLDQRERIRRWAWAMVGVLALGLARLGADLLGGRPVWFLVGALVAVGIAAAGLFRRLPFRTLLGEQLLARLTEKNTYLSPDFGPSWHTYGPSATMLALALFGESALRSADPVFADEVAGPATYGGGGSLIGGSCGGGSCGAGGSSCGGGSCGGGGGSCGGGGGGGCGGGN